eukprot:1332297-Rhodomonas_salina.2
MDRRLFLQKELTEAENLRQLIIVQLENVSTKQERRTLRSEMKNVTRLGATIIEQIRALDDDVNTQHSMVRNQAVASFGFATGNGNARRVDGRTMRDRTEVQKALEHSRKHQNEQERRNGSIAK